MRASLQAYDDVFAQGTTATPNSNSASDATLSSLRTLLFDGTVDSASTSELTSYDLRRMRTAEEKLHSSLSANAKLRKLWKKICLLARLRVAFHNFKDITLALPSFEAIKIILLPRLPAPAKPTQRALNLKQTFSILQLGPSEATRKAVVGQNWTSVEIERKVAKPQKQRPNVHAEAQLLMSLNVSSASGPGLFPYLGCSNLNCFMCNHFI